VKITLKRKLELKSAIVYLKLNRKVPRDDIKGFLNGDFEFPNEIVMRRVKDYLCNTGIYDSGYNLTEKGREVRETGLVSEPEEGVYQIWYTQGDFLFDNRIFYFTRVKPEPYAKENIKESNLDLSGPFISLPVMGKGESVLNLEFSIAEMGKWEEKTGATINCTWIWGVKGSEFNFSGSLRTDKTDKNSKPSIEIDKDNPLDLKVPIERHISSVLPNWNPDTGRCGFKLENIKDEDKDTYIYFEYSGDRPSQEYAKEYSSCHYEKLPIEPYNLEEAQKWREKIIKLELAKNYMHPNDFTDCVIEANRKDGFSAYSEELYADIPDAGQYVSELDPGKKSDRGRDFWHLAAPLDLNVGVPQSLKKGSFSLVQGDKHSLRDIARRLFSEISSLEMVLYYDRFVGNGWQQRSVCSLLECFGCHKTYVITNTSLTNFDSYLNGKSSVTLEDIGSVYKNGKNPPHDRYIVFKHGGIFDVWQCGNSIGFIRFKSKNEISADSHGTIITSATFTKVERRVLGEELSKYLEGK